MAETTNERRQRRRASGTVEPATEMDTRRWNDGRGAEVWRRAREKESETAVAMEMAGRGTRWLDHDARKLQLAASTSGDRVAASAWREGRGTWRDLYLQFYFSLRETFPSVFSSGSARIRSFKWAVLMTDRKPPQSLRKMSHKARNCRVSNMTSPNKPICLLF